VTQSSSAAQSDPALAVRPGHKIVRVGADGAGWVEAFRCPNCAAVVAELTRACRRCGSRDAQVPFRPLPKGTLYSWTVVHRSYPGIAVPFVSAIVDLDGGLALKGTLRLDDLTRLQPGMPVKLVLDDAGGATDNDGRPYAGFHFTAEGAGP
jgi:uncharacterized protein